MNSFWKNFVAPGRLDFRNSPRRTSSTLGVMWACSADVIRSSAAQAAIVLGMFLPVREPELHDQQNENDQVIDPHRDPTRDRRCAEERAPPGGEVRAPQSGEVERGSGEREHDQA